MLFTVVPNISRQLPVTSDLLAQTTTYFPVTSFGVGSLVFRLKFPISYAALGPSDLTSSVVTLGSVTCSAMCSHITLIAALPFTIADPRGRGVASSV